MADRRSKTRLVGLSSIQYCTVRSHGGFPTTASSLNTIGYVVPDSAHIIIDPPGVTDLMIEEEDTPDIQILGNRKVSLEFGLRDMGTRTLLLAFGGVISGSVTWKAPVTSNVITEWAFEIHSKTINGKYLKFQIPRASVSVGGDLKFARSDSGTLNFSAQVLIPESSTQISPCVITQT